MKKEEQQKLFKGIEKKLGKDNYSKIADDIGVLITDNETMNNTIANKDEQIEQLNKDKEVLITANGNLLQQVGMGEEIKKDEDKEDEKPKISIKSVFDEKGNFIN